MSRVGFNFCPKASGWAGLGLFSVLMLWVGLGFSLGQKLWAFLGWVWIEISGFFRSRPSRALNFQVGSGWVFSIFLQTLMACQRGWVICSVLRRVEVKKN